MEHPRPIRVLLVEDDPEDALLTRKLFSQIERERFEVDWVGSYEEALDALRARRHDVCLLDFQLGEKTGVELLQEAAAAGCRLPTLMLTGQNAYEADLAASAAGAVDYLVKDEMTPALLERAVRYARASHQRERLLAETQAQLQLVAEQLPGGVWTTDDQLRYTWTAGPYMAHAGSTAEAMVGRTLAEVLGLDDAEAPALAAHRQALEGHAARYEAFFAGRPNEVHVRPLRAADGAIIGVLGMALDISERKQAEEALLRSRARFQAFMDNSPVYAWLKDAGGRYLYGNRLWQKLVARPLEEALGKTEGELFPPEVAARFRKHDTTLLADQQPLTLEESLEQPDGSLRHTLVYKFTIQDQEGQPLIGGVALDITSQRQAEAQLQRQLGILEGVTEGATDAIFVKDGAGRYLMINSAGASFMGARREEILGKRDAEFFSPDTLHEVLETDRQALAGNSVEREERITAAGITRVYHAVKAPLRNAEGEVVGLVGISRDITERRRAAEELAQSERRYASLVHASSQMVWRASADGQVLLGDHPDWVKFTGQSCAESERDGWLNAVHPEDHPRIAALWREILADPRPAEAEFRLRTVSGEYRHIFAGGVPVRSDAGEVVEWIGVCTDVTEQRRAELALRESEARFRSMAESAPIGIYLSDVNSRGLYLNPTLERLLGMSLEQSHTGWAEGIHPEDRERVLSSWHAAVEALELWRSSHRTVLPDGTVHWMDVQAAPIWDEERHLGFVGMVHDVTEYKRLEQALRDSERRFRVMAEFSPLGICLTDAAGEHVYSNAAWQRQLGLPDAALTRGGWIHALHPDDRDRVATNWMKAAKEGQPYQARHRWVHPDGTIVHAQVHFSPIREGSDLLGFVGVGEDVTERLALEQQVLQSQKMEAIGNLAGGIAHDFNNMLAVINGYSELLLAGLRPGAPMQAYVAEISKAGDRAANLTRQLLAFSRKQLLETKVLDLNDVVQKVDRMLRRLIGEDIELVTLLDPGLGRVKADPGQVEQVLMNLAVNARDAMPQGGRLLLRTRNAEAREIRAVTVAGGSYVVVEVEDTGCGMQPEVLEHIFEPFFTTKEQGRGTGLGLATVYGIVKQSGGYIDVASEPGAGSRFTIYLPQVEEQAPAEEGFTQRVLPSGSETILLVEDEPMVRAMVRTVLAECGYTVLEAMQGDDALRLAEEHEGPIHLLLTDVVMPRMSGRELAERLTAQRPDTQVLFMSGYTDDAVMRHGVEDAEMELLQKPFTHLALAQRIRRLLDRAQLQARRDQILLIDDDAPHRETLAELLRVEGYEVTSAGEGGEAFALLRTGVKVDVILLDLMMAGMNGWVFRMEQQKDPALAGIPIIVISGQQDPSGVAEFLKPAACLTKPVDVERLLELIAGLCVEGDPGRQPRQ